MNVNIVIWQCNNNKQYKVSTTYAAKLTYTVILNRSRELHEKTEIVMRTIKLREQTQSYITHWLDEQTTQPHHCTGTYLWSLSTLRNHSSWILWPQIVKQCIHHRIKNWVACKNRKEKCQILKKNPNISYGRQIQKWNEPDNTQMQNKF